MPTISFLKKMKPLDVPPGTNLMKVLLEHGVPVASSCLGDGICGKCKITILEGEENLSPANDTEMFLKEKYKLPRAARISCQTQVFGNIKIDASYW